jgi:hypothetical protein
VYNSKDGDTYAIINLNTDDRIIRGITVGGRAT